VKEPIMQRALAALVATAAAFGAATGAACRLDPLVKDDPGSSVAILPADAVIPSVTVNAELTNQITLNDSLDSKALAAMNSLIARGSGFAGTGMPVSYWSFGTVNRAPAPVYIFGTGDPTTTAFTQNSHPGLVDAVPGDVEYSPFHAIYRVQVTDKYQGEKITTTAALADAIELGLVEAPVAIKHFVNTPIVRPGTTLDVGAAGTATPTKFYAKGYVVDTYRLGGAFAEQPNPNGLLPTSQVSFLRGPTEGPYDRTRPIFQASVPMVPPQDTPNYTALSVVINVDLNRPASDVTSDAELFVRDSSGAIMRTTSNVIAFTVTTMQLDLQLVLPGAKP
jgi:hypothetical protein